MKYMKFKKQASKENASCQTNVVKKYENTKPNRRWQEKYQAFQHSNRGIAGTFLRAWFIIRILIIADKALQIAPKKNTLSLHSEKSPRIWKYPEGYSFSKLKKTFYFWTINFANWLKPRFLPDVCTVWKLSMKVRNSIPMESWNLTALTELAQVLTYATTKFDQLEHGSYPIYVLSAWLQTQ